MHDIFARSTELSRFYAQRFWRPAAGDIPLKNNVYFGDVLADITAAVMGNDHVV